MQDFETMKVKNFITKYMHNNSVKVYNKYGAAMHNNIDGDITMDWMLPKSTIRDCEVLRIYGAIGGAIGVYIDTTEINYQMIPELCNSPLWLYNETHPNNKIEGSTVK